MALAHSSTMNGAKPPFLKLEGTGGHEAPKHSALGERSSVNNTVASKHPSWLRTRARSSGEM